jgi:hypothetical protein
MKPLSRRTTYILLGLAVSGFLIGVIVDFVYVFATSTKAQDAISTIEQLEIENEILQMQLYEQRAALHQQKSLTNQTVISWDLFEDGIFLVYFENSDTPLQLRHLWVPEAGYIFENNTIFFPNSTDVFIQEALTQ